MCLLALPLAPRCKLSFSQPCSWEACGTGLVTIVLGENRLGMTRCQRAEEAKIIHSLQHELTDADKRLALLQLDIANAFNSCDRARVLRELYALPALLSVYRIADFAYTQPSALVLSGCNEE